MHRAKRTEFSNVLLIGVDSDALPAPFALKGLTDSDRDDSLQKERSLL